MTHSDRDGGENAARELGKIAAQIAGFAAPAGLPLHESADRDATDLNLVVDLHDSITCAECQRLGSVCGPCRAVIAASRAFFEPADRDADNERSPIEALLNHVGIETPNGVTIAADRDADNVPSDRVRDADLDALDELLADATPAPWNFAPGPHPDSHKTKAEYLAGMLRDDDANLWVAFTADPEGEPDDYLVPAVTGDGPTGRANAAFIANARNLLPALLAEVRAARAALRGPEPTGDGA